MKISIIGAGAMGGALAEGLIKGDYIQNEDICVADPSRDSREHFSNLGITATPSNQLAAQGADIVCVVVKPWLVEQVLKGIKDVLDYSNQLLIVVAAGVKSTDINTWLDKGGDTIPTFLVIPNIAIAHLQSMTFIVPDANATQQQTEQVKALFDSMGKSIITDENHLAAGTTLASCGIALHSCSLRRRRRTGFQGRRCQEYRDADHEGSRRTTGSQRSASRSSHRPGNHSWRCDHQRSERNGARRIHIQCY